MHNRSFTKFNYEFPQLFGSSFNALKWITTLQYAFYSEISG